MTKIYRANVDEELHKDFRITCILNDETIGDALANMIKDYVKEHKK